MVIFLSLEGILVILRVYFGNFYFSGVFRSSCRFFGHFLGFRAFWSFFKFKGHFGNFLGLGCILVIYKFQRYFGHFIGFGGYFGHFQGFGDILDILEVLGGILLILEILEIFWSF